MFGLRKRQDGFEWRKYVRTTILIRREKRRQRIDDARIAAIDGLKDAGRKGAAVGASGLQRAFDTAMAAIGKVVPSVKVAVDRATPRLKAFSEAVAERVGPVLSALPRPGTRELLVAAGAVVALTAARYVPWSNIEVSARTAPVFAASAALIALAAMLITGRPIRLYNELRRLGHRVAQLPGVDRASPRSAAAATLAAAVAAAGYLIWTDVNASGPVASLTAARTSTTSPPPSKLVGRAVVGTGDTLRLQGTSVRLSGIEAPDHGQQCMRDGSKHWKCGVAAKQALAKLVSGQTVACDVSGRDRAGVPLATCYVKDKDLAAELVRAGHVFSSGGLFSGYSGVESEAKSLKAGIWAGEAQRPADYRAKRWEEAKRAAPDGCPIKGSVSSGSRVYVLPWSPKYDHVKIKSAKGERWFCSEQEAQSAGWRPVEQS